MDVDGTTDATTRMAQIAAQLATMSRGATAPPTPASRVAGAASPSSTSASAPAGQSFDAVLASALSGSTSGSTPGSGTSSSSGLSALSGALSSSGGSDASDSSDASDTTNDPGVAALAAALVAARPPALSPARTATVGSATVATATAAPVSPSLSAVATKPSAAATPAAPAVGTGTLTATGSPSDLRAYGNGRIPAALLSPLGVGGHRLWAPAADNFRRMHAAAARDGVQIGVNDSYRSYSEQVDLARTKGLYSQGGLAAAPGTSDHGWGKSVDLQLDGRAQSWMRTHAAQYGFSANVPRESWHWTYAPR